MRKIVVGAFVSLDGVMQAPGGRDEDPSGGFKYGGWVFPLFDEAIGTFVDEMMAEPFDLLLGRKTYDIFAPYWGSRAETDDMGALLTRVGKYVATSGREPLAWNNTTVLTGDVAAELAKLKRTEGPRLLTQGSTVVIQTLLAHDLIDEFRVMTFPVILGPGKRLFADGTQPAGLKLTSSRLSTTGAVMSVYARDGDVETGSFDD